MCTRGHSPTYRAIDVQPTTLIDSTRSSLVVHKKTKPSLPASTHRHIPTSPQPTSLNKHNGIRHGRARHSLRHAELGGSNSEMLPGLDSAETETTSARELLIETGGLFVHRSLYARAALLY